MPDGTENKEYGLRIVSFITHLHAAHICEHKYRRPVMFLGVRTPSQQIIPEPKRFASLLVGRQRSRAFETSQVSVD